MLSAHWENRPVTLGATRTVPLVYDFYGFPQKYYEQQYPAPGAPQLAERIRKELKSIQPVADQPERGLDHGAYVPLVAMYPEADVPVLQMSLPSENPQELFALGRALRALRVDIADECVGCPGVELGGPRFPITGFWMGSLTRRSVQFG